MESTFRNQVADQAVPGDLQELRPRSCGRAGHLVDVASSHDIAPGSGSRSSSPDERRRHRHGGLRARRSGAAASIVKPAPGRRSTLRTDAVRRFGNLSAGLPSYLSGSSDVRSRANLERVLDQFRRGPHGRRMPGFVSRHDRVTRRRPQCKRKCHSHR